MYVDSHCHLVFPQLAERLDAILEEMREAGVGGALCICTTLEEFPRLRAMVDGHRNLWASVGVHPDNEDAEDPDVETLVRLASDEKVVAIGETGLDYYRAAERPREAMEWQRERFRRHIRAARRVNRPLVIHTRAASDDTLSILREEGGGDARGVFHCFTESRGVAQAALDLGFLVSFSGIVTFRNAEALREVARFVPLDRMLIETDSPYLAPVPFRGKTNTPALVPWVAKQIAESRGVPVETIAEATVCNFEALFGIRLPPAASLAAAESITSS